MKKIEKNQNENIQEKKKKIKEFIEKGKEENNKTSFVTNTMSGISKYKYLIVGIVVVVGVVLTIFVLKKKGSAL